MDKKTRDKARAKEWRKKNQEKVKAYNKMRYERDVDKIRAYSIKFMDNLRFGGQSEDVLERDNWECQECGMSQEQCIVLFNRKLYIHHIDGNGSASGQINNDMDNLRTLCPRCHGKIHREIYFKEKWGKLIEQDDSDWKFPKIRYLVEAEIRKGLGVQEAKKKVSKDTGMGFSLIDKRYYMKKTSETSHYD